MKKAILVAAVTIISMFFLVGCSAIQVSTSTTDTTSTTTTTTVSKAYKYGKMAGKIIGIKYKDIVDLALPYAKELLASAESGTITDTQIESAITKLTNQLGASDDAQIVIAALEGGIDITVTVGTVNTNIVDFLKGFIEGAGAYSTASLSVLMLPIN